jgi:Xaa-Pro aminopeptidase
MAMTVSELRSSVCEKPHFAAEEYESRIHRARKAMEQQRLDAVILMDPSSICYFTGFHTVNLWDPTALIISIDGSVRLVLWEFELPRFEVSAVIGDPIAYSVAGDPVQHIRDILRPMRIRSYAIDDWTRWGPASMVVRLHAELQPAVSGDARPVLWQTRLRKTPAELDVLREAAKLTDTGVAAALAAAEAAVRDQDIAAAAAAAMLRSGSGHFAIQPIVAVGPRAGIMHSEGSGRVIEAGDAIFVELGAALHRYTAPVMRTFVIGSPSDRVSELARLASHSVHAAVEAIKPGVACSAVARAVQAAMAAAPSEISFHGYAGYPVGISFPPSWIEDLDFYINLQNNAPIEEGMVFHIPLTLREKGKHGVGLSYTVSVTTDGAKILTGSSAKLIVQ